MFILLSLLTLPDPRAVKVRARSWILPVSFCALALGAKEASAVFPVLVFAWARLVHPSSAEGRAPWKSALRVAAPFFAVGLFYVGVRAWVLGGAGGNVHSWTWTLASIPALGTRAADFVGDLVYPVRVLFHPYLNATDRVLACAAAIGMCALTPGIKRLWDSSVSSVDGRPRSRLALHSCLIVGVAALSFPAVSWWIRGAIEQAYRNEGWAFLGRMIDWPRKQPVEFYVWKAFELARITATGALVVSGALLAITWRRARTPKGATSIEQRWSWVFALWILLHLALFLAVQRYHSWYAYVPAIPFCCCLGMVVSKGARPLEIRTALPVGLMVWLAAYSPLVRGLESWRENAKFNGVVMSEISRMAASAPAGSTLEFIDLPNQNFSWHQHGPEPFSPFTINVAGTVSWVKLVQPDRELRVVVKSQRTVQGPVSSIRMVAERAEDQRTIVYSTVTLAPSD
jgi:hypothetical protein